MENKVDNKLAKIESNIDDINIKNINSYNPSKEIKNDIIESTPLQNPSKYNNNSNSYKSLSILDRTSELFNIKTGLDKKIEERKNIENDNIKNFKSNLLYNNNYITNENNSLNSNILNYSKYKTNIKETLYQNKNIINNINSIINNDINDDKKNIINTKTNNLETNKNPLKKEYKDNNIKKAKTFYNYNESIEKQMGEEDNYLDKYNLQKLKNFDFERNEINYKKTDGPNNMTGYNSSNPGKDFNKEILTNGQKDEYKLTITTTKNNLTDSNDNLNSDIKLVNSKDYYFNYRSEESFNKINESGTRQIIDNYKMSSSSLNSNYNKVENTSTNINISTNKSDNNKYLNNNIKNDYSFKTNNDNNFKYNNYLNNNDTKIKNNYKYNNTIDSKVLEEKEKHIKLQLENEEKKLKELEEEKDQIIKEEKQRRENFYKKINKKKNNYSHIKQDLQKEDDIKKDETPIKPIYNLNDNNNRNINEKYNNNNNNNDNGNFYIGYLKEIQERNEKINKNTLDTINNNINKNKNNYKYETNNTNERSNSKKKSLSVDNKQNEIKDYLYNYNSNITNNDNKNDINSKLYNNYNSYNQIENEYNYNKISKKTRYESERRYNINSYFQLKDREYNIEVNDNKLKYDINYDNKSKDDQSLSSFNDETIKENNYFHINNYNINKNNKNYQVSLTPNGLYRNHKSENYLYNTNPRANNIDNNHVTYNNNKDYYNISKDINNNNKEEVIKTLCTNDSNNLTQTRFYRNKEFPEPPISSYESNILKSVGTTKEYTHRNYNISNNFKKQNSTRTISHLNFDLDKEYINNSNNYNTVMSTSQNNTIMNNKYNTLSNNNQNNNLYHNNNITNKVNSYRSKCTLRKGKSYNDFNKLIDSNNNDNSIFGSLNKNIHNRNEKNIKYDMSSINNKRNNYCCNMMSNDFNKNNNTLNYYNNWNTCEKCSRKLFSNENNGNYGNTFGNYSTMRLCNNCKKLNDNNNNNNIKRNINYFNFA